MNFGLVWIVHFLCTDQFLPYHVPVLGIILQGSASSCFTLASVNIALPPQDIRGFIVGVLLHTSVVFAVVVVVHCLAAPMAT